MAFNFITAEEAASYIKNNDVIGIGGFSSVGTVKAVTTALAEK
ncbi:MAG: hypothetical protein J6U08_03675, partial [Paludibacteraceae bacterium]|nr:hypothetical protein [Paludibacteraceae bacterium]